MAETQRILGHLVPALRLHEALADRFAEDHDARGLTWAVSGIGQILLHLGETDLAVVRFLQAEESGASVGDRTDVAFAVRGQAEAALRQEDYDRAYRLAQQALLRFRQVGYEVGVGYALRTLSHISAVTGDPMGALDHARDALAVFEGINDTRGLAYVRESIAQIDPGADLGPEAPRRIRSSQPWLAPLPKPLHRVGPNRTANRRKSN